MQESQALGLQRRPRGQRFLGELHGLRCQRQAQYCPQLGASGSALCTRGTHGREAVLTYRGSTRLDARPITDGVWLEGGA